uniref:F-box domain-containing protein n=1 Tax=Mycena chlorophos TaxID=658473 RepID=A0ABQ0M090_MYCCL|nr:predicted protein [Mycena chlorophos]
MVGLTKSVQSRLEPILYDSLDLSKESIFDAFIRAARYKPALLSLGTREMIVPKNSWTSAVPVHVLHDGIRLCSRLERLSFARDLATPALLPVLASLPLRRLVTAVVRLLPESSANTASTTSWLAEASNALKHITHLEPLEDITLPDSERTRQLVAALPSLTHLASLRGNPNFDVDTWLETVPHLVVFVFIHGAHQQVPFRDARIAVTTWRKWHEGSTQMWSYWDRAEKYLRSKERNLPVSTS